MYRSSQESTPNNWVYIHIFLSWKRMWKFQNGKERRNNFSSALRTKDSRTWTEDIGSPEPWRIINFMKILMRILINTSANFCRIP